MVGRKEGTNRWKEKTNILLGQADIIGSINETSIILVIRISKRISEVIMRFAFKKVTLYIGPYIYIYIYIYILERRWNVAISLGRDKK